jgi:hypothetical protein
MSAVVRMKLSICKNRLHALILCENRATESNADLLHVPLAASFHSGSVPLYFQFMSTETKCGTHRNKPLYTVQVPGGAMLSPLYTLQAP